MAREDRAKPTVATHSTTQTAVDIASLAINGGNVVARADPAGPQTSKTNFQKLSA